MEDGELSVMPLGGGQHVGRSCLVLTIGGRRVLLDCGIHPGLSDDRRFPDFSLLARETAATSQPGRAASSSAAAAGGGDSTEGSGPLDYTSMIDAVIISHFHLDHIGALPYLTEVLGYRGPVVMTHPTKAVAPMLLRDYRKVSDERRRHGGAGSGATATPFSNGQVAASLQRATAVGLHETLRIGAGGTKVRGQEDLELTAYYAGHVIGAAMFHIRVGALSTVYTGDFSSVADHHLRAASIPRLCPSLMITEGTYATAPRTWKRGREHELLESIRQCVMGGGKVLIPVFAVGRAQEVCVMLNTYWEQTGLGGRVPIVFAPGIAEQATAFYRAFSSWTNASAEGSNAFDFRHMEVFCREKHWPAVVAEGQPMVCFATPAMLNGGLALEVFREWAGDKRNLLVMTGYCVAGTVGHAVVTGQRQGVCVDASGTTIDVRCAVRNVSFSAHADADGLLSLLRQAAPQNVVLVHGEAAKLRAFRRRVAKELQIPCAAPPNGTTVRVNCGPAAAAAPPGSELADPRRLDSGYIPRRGGRLRARSAPCKVDVAALENSSSTLPAGVPDWLAGAAEVASASASAASASLSSSAAAVGFSQCSAPTHSATSPRAGATLTAVTTVAAAVSCELRWDLIDVSSKRKRGDDSGDGSAGGLGGVAATTSAAAVMAEVVQVFRRVLYCGYLLHGDGGEDAGRTLRTDGGGVLLNVAPGGRSLTLRWRGIEDGRLAAAIVAALRRALAHRLFSDSSPSAVRPEGCC